MKWNCYIVEVTTALEDLFEQLNDYGFEYFCDDFPPVPGFIEIHVQYYPHEIQDLENIMKWYV